MDQETRILLSAAASLGLIHTLAGPDHYLPFIALGKARGWSLPRTLAVTAACGTGHVLGSVVLGLVGIGLGLAIGTLEVVDGVRGEIASWLLISFGLVYMAWGLRRISRSRPHVHPHAHLHPERPAGITPWTLFVVFVLGPCEPLIPLLMYPAAGSGWTDLLAITLVFALCTVGTMLLMVTLADRGLRLVPLRRMEPYAHPLAGLTICASGLAILLLGL